MYFNIKSFYKSFNDPVFKSLEFLLLSKIYNGFEIQENRENNMTCKYTYSMQKDIKSPKNIDSGLIKVYKNAVNINGEITLTNIIQNISEKK
jgi:citrate lyase synthetase